MKLETICLRGHLEFVAPAPEGLPFYPYIGRTVCQRVFKDQTVCASPIVNTFTFDEDEAVRPGPDDSVAPGAAEAIDEQATLVKQIEEVAAALLARGEVLTTEDAGLVADFAARTGVSLPTVTRLVETAGPVEDDEVEDEEETDVYEEETEPAREPFGTRIQRALEPLAVLLPYRPLLIAAAVGSLLLSLYLLATGHPLLALLM